LISLRMSFKKQ